MRIVDEQIVRLLDEAIKASSDGQRRAASALLRLLRSGEPDRTALEHLAAKLGRSCGPEIRRYYWDLCRKLGLCE